jgi:ketosteroid isomerase-like protein
MEPTIMLPAAITQYLKSHVARDVDGVMRWYAADAEVTDNGRTHHGRDAIRAWFASATSEYTYTTELTGSRQVDERTYVATQHLEGNFPGGTVDLDFTFTLNGDLIERLVIG